MLLFKNFINKVLTVIDKKPLWNLRELWASKWGKPKTKPTEQKIEEVEKVEEVEYVAYYRDEYGLIAKQPSPGVFVLNQEVVNRRPIIKKKKVPKISK